MMPRPLPSLRAQRGAALMVMLIVVVIGAATIFVTMLNSSSLQIERDKITSDALAQAKEALIGYAASVNLTSARLGDLPCPDLHTPNTALEGTSSTPCSGNAIGRLPWKTLGLPDLRDGSNEKLWYAVSKNFKNSPRTTCTNSNLSGCLNSDTLGTISVFSSSGTIVNDGGGNNGAVAVVIAPGAVLTRTDQTSPQNRSSTGINIANNFMDIATIGGSTKDNANFTDGSSSNGFIQGRVLDSNGNLILNDQLLVITQANIMQLLQKRVAAEVKLCLNEYAATNNDRYPWAAKLNSANPVSYNDTSGQLFGRIPDQNFDSTKSDSGNKMSNVWGANCNLQYGIWWRNWKEMVFYGISSAYRPENESDKPSCGTCLTVNPPSATGDKKFVVLVAGKTLPGQSRSNDSNKGNASNYLEGNNANGASPFTQGPLSPMFNDTVVFQ